MPQLLLFIAIMFELVASTFLKLSDGFKNIFFWFGSIFVICDKFLVFCKITNFHKFQRSICHMVFSGYSGYDADIYFHI